VKIMTNWATQMTLWCGGVMVFGLVLMGGAFPATAAPVTLLLELLGADAPIEFDALHRFSLALMGAVSLGWGASLLAVARITPELSAQQAQKLWRMVTYAILLWFVVDSALSVATGFWRNSISNTLLLAWYLLLVAKLPGQAAQAARA
jgi:hypothetical protein